MSRDETGRRREWDAQESALRRERAGAPAGGDPLVAQYRIVAQVLRDPPLDALPDDFAATVAARAEQRMGLGDDVVEVWLPRALVGVLTLAGVGTAVAYGAGTWRLVGGAVAQTAEAVSHGPVAGWIVAIGACVALSALIERSVRRST